LISRRRSGMDEFAVLQVRSNLILALASVY
jgi:hypothetical protein